MHEREADSLVYRVVAADILAHAPNLTVLRCDGSCMQATRPFEYRLVGSHGLRQPGEDLKGRRPVINGDWLEGIDLLPAADPAGTRRAGDSAETRGIDANVVRDFDRNCVRRCHNWSEPENLTAIFKHSLCNCEPDGKLLVVPWSSHRGAELVKPATLVEVDRQGSLHDDCVRENLTLVRAPSQGGNVCAFDLLLHRLRLWDVAGAAREGEQSAENVGVPPSNIEAAVNVAAMHWPQESRSALIRRLILLGAQRIVEGPVERTIQIELALKSLEELGDAYPPGYLEEMRRDWEGRPE